MEKNMTKEEILYNGKFEKDKVIKKYKIIIRYEKCK